MYAFFKNEIVPLAEAKLPITTHAFHYGTACFEGIRGNWNEEQQQLYVFRPIEHFQRLIASAKILRMGVRFSPEQLCDIMDRLIRASDIKDDLYIRPVAYKSAEVVANLKAHELEDDFMMFVMPLGNYLDPSKGIHCATSSWRRIDDMSLPARGKITGGYVNSVLAKTEATESGFDEAIMLNADGHVSEGSGENVFIVSGGKLVTPAPNDNILLGITRDTIIQLAREELDIETVERSIDRTELYQADECFLTGTAAHLTPVNRVDHRLVGDGEIGRVTSALQELYFDVIRGRNPRDDAWRHPVYPAAVRA